MKKNIFITLLICLASASICNADFYCVDHNSGTKTTGQSTVSESGCTAAYCTSSPTDCYGSILLTSANNNLTPTTEDTVIKATDGTHSVPSPWFFGAADDGTSSFDVVIKGVSSASTIFDCSTTSRCFQPGDLSYVTFQDMTLIGGTTAGIRIATTAAHATNITLKRLVVHSSGNNGIDANDDEAGADVFWVQDLLIEDVVARHNTAYGIWLEIESGTINDTVSYGNGSAGSNQISIGARNNGTIIINDTEAYDDGTAGAGSSGFGSAPSAGATVIFNECKSHDNTGDGFVGHGTGTNTYNSSYAYNNARYGMIDVAGDIPTNNYNNCTITGNASIGVFLQTAGTFTFKNNIVHNNGESVPASGLQVSWNELGSTLTSDYNIITEHSLGRTIFDRTESGFDTLTQWQSENSQDANSLGQDPMFAAVSRNDYGLQDGSPAIKAGTGTKYNGLVADIGACQTSQTIEIYPGMGEVEHGICYPLSTNKNLVTIP